LLIKKLQIVTVFKKMTVCSSKHSQSEGRVKFTGEFAWEKVNYIQPSSSSKEKTVYMNIF